MEIQRGEQLSPNAWENLALDSDLSGSKSWCSESLCQVCPRTLAQGPWCHGIWLRGVAAGA